MNEQERNEFAESAKMALAQSWEAHRQAFGPILEPAFKDRPPLRIPLTAALNHISRKEIKKGIEILESLKEHCTCDEDHAAWTFCVGLAFEIAGDQQKMVRWYTKAGDYGHRFYLPYFKIAKVAYFNLHSETAAENYARGLTCLLEAKGDDADTAMLVSAYVNLCTVLTMIHRYDEAEKAWEMVKNYPLPPTSFASGAVLFAAKGDPVKTAECLHALQKAAPLQYDATKSRCEGILEGRNGHFSVIPFEKDAVEAFWHWFEANEKHLAQTLETNEAEALALIKKALTAVCPLFTAEPRIHIKKKKDGYLLTVEDFYAKTLTEELPKLFAARPETVAKTFSFAVSHSA